MRGADRTETKMTAREKDHDGRCFQTHNTGTSAAAVAASVAAVVRFVRADGGRRRCRRSSWARSLAADAGDRCASTSRSPSEMGRGVAIGSDGCRTVSGGRRDGDVRRRVCPCHRAVEVEPGERGRAATLAPLATILFRAAADAARRRLVGGRTGSGRDDARRDGCGGGAHMAWRVTLRCSEVSSVSPTA